MMRVMTSWHRRSGDKFQGMDLLYLTTVGAKTGQKRQSAVSRFPDGEDAWLVVASAGGSAHHPAWYHNIAAHPDQVWIEFGGRQLRVTPTQLDGDARAQAWQRITQLQPRYAGYEQKTTAPSRSSGSPAPTEPGEPHYRGPLDARALEGGFTDLSRSRPDLRKGQSRQPFRHVLDMIMLWLCATRQPGALPIIDQACYRALRGM